MSKTIELPARFDPTLALKFIPVVELQETFANFEQWEHSVRFYLRYNGLLEFIGEGDDSPVAYTTKDRDPKLHNRLFVYSLIWKSAVAVFRPSQLKDLQNELYQNREHDPKQLWKILHDRRGSVRNLSQLDLDYSD